MEKQKIYLLGYERKSGTFEAEDTQKKIDYDNIVCHCQICGAVGVVGYGTATVKIKAKELQIIGAKTLDELVGKQITFFSSPIPRGGSFPIVGISLVSSDEA